MKAFKIHILLLLNLFLAVYQVCQANVPARDIWLGTRSENFQLAGDASEKELRQTALRLERFHEILSRQFPNLKLTAPVPTTVLVFGSDISFALYRERGTANKSLAAGGFFVKGEDENFMAVSAEKLKTDSFRQIYHQYSHFLINNNPGKSRIPPWLYEGLAEYYEDLQIAEDGSATFGNARPDYQEILKNNDLIPLETFFNISFYEVHQQEKEGESLYYAQSWALMHYLVNAKPKELNQFIERLSAGQPVRDAFVKTFQTNLTGLEKDLKNYIEQKSFQKSQKTFPKEINLKFSTVSEAEREFQVGSLLYALSHFDEAETHFRRAVELKPDFNLALASIGLIKTRQYKYIEAERLAEEAVTSDDRNYLTWFRYAYILSRRNMTEHGFVSDYTAAAADKMREALKKAMTLNPDFAESYNLYALVSFVRNEELDKALDYLNKALEIAPGNQQYALRFAELSMRKERFAEARRTAQSVLNNASEPSLRLYAQNTVMRIDSTEQQLMSARRDRDKYVNDDTVTDTPMSEEEIARRRALAMMESIRRGLRKPAAGQKQIAGSLINIECESKRVNFVLKTDGETVKLQANSLEGISLITYNQNMYGTEIGCGVIKKDNNAVIIYMAGEAGKTNILGQIVSIEFVPKEFKLLGKN